MTAIDSTPCYVAEKACGCTVACIVDPEHQKDAAREVSKWLRSGLVIKRITVEEARTLIKLCTHKQVPS